MWLAGRLSQTWSGTNKCQVGPPTENLEDEFEYEDDYDLEHQRELSAICVCSYLTCRRTYLRIGVSEWFAGTRLAGRNPPVGGHDSGSRKD